MPIIESYPGVIDAWDFEIVSSNIEGDRLIAIFTVSYAFDLSFEERICLIATPFYGTQKVLPADRSSNEALYCSDYSAAYTQVKIELPLVEGEPVSFDRILVEAIGETSNESIFGKVFPFSTIELDS